VSDLDCLSVPSGTGGGGILDRRLPWLGEISEHTVISYRTLPLRSLVTNRVGIRTAFQVSPQVFPADHREADLTTLRRTVIFLHG